MSFIRQYLSISLVFVADMGLRGMYVVLPFTLTINGLIYLLMINRVDFVGLAAAKFKETIRFKEK